MSRQAAATGLAAALCAAAAAGGPSAAARVSAPAASCCEADFDRAVAAHQAGRGAQALALYRDIAARAGPRDAALAAAALTNACVLLADAGRPGEAKPLCREALALAEAGGGSLVEATLNLARVEDETGDRSAARAMLARALGEARRAGDGEAEVIALANAASLETSAGRYQAALERLAEAEMRLDRWVGGGPGEAWAEAQREIARLNRGVVLEKLGRYREALPIYEDLLRTGSRDARRRSAILVNAGVVERNLGEPHAAVSRFDAAIALLRAAGDRAGLANAWLNRGLALELDLGRPREAELAYDRAVIEARASGEADQSLLALTARGRLLRSAGRGEEARRDYGEALAIARAAEAPEGIWAAEEGLGRLALAAGDAPTAAAHFAAAMDAIETTRTELRTGPDRAAFFGDKRAVYRAALDLAAGATAAADPAEALAHVQRAKARDLIDALGASAAGARGLEGFSVESLRAALGPEDALIEFAFGERSLYRFLVRRDRVRVEARLEAGDARRLAAAVVAPEALGQPAASVEARRLAAALFGDLGAPRPRRWLLAPDGALFAVPLERLLVEHSGERMAEAEVLLQPSAASWWALRHGGAAADGAPVPRTGSAQRGDFWQAFGPPLRPAAPGLRALPGAEAEVGSLAGWLRRPGRAYLGAESTEASFARAASSPARLLHVATHATAPAGDGDDEGGLALGLESEEGAEAPYPPPERDGWVTPAEVAGRPRALDLVVLSACTSGGGLDDAAGRALASLAGGFLAAGARGVVVSRWQVDDAATRVWMEQFYGALVQGRTPGRAAAMARQRLRQDPRWNRPEVWAAWAVIGDPPALFAPRRWPWLLAGLATCAAALLLAPWRRRASRGATGG